MVEEIQSGPFNLCAKACVTEKLTTRCRRRELRYPYIREPSSRVRMAGRNFSISKLYARYRRARESAPLREIRISEERRSERSGNCEEVSPSLVGGLRGLSKAREDRRKRRLVVVVVVAVVGGEGERCVFTEKRLYSRLRIIDFN